jgi:hypothetical protein
MKLSHPRNSTDPDIRGSWTALLRAAKFARKLSIATGTPFWVMRNGEIVDLNAPLRARAKRNGSRRQKKSRTKH